MINIGKSKSIEWGFNKPAITLHLVSTDELWYGLTDNHGNPYTKKRKYVGKKATVIQGEHEVKDQQIYVTNNYKIWSCNIYAAGKASSIGLKNEYVTMIIHM